MDLEFDFGDACPFPELKALRRGDTVQAAQFLLWFAGRDEASAEEAALELEKRGISLDVSDYQPAYKAGPMGERLALEKRLTAEERLESSLEPEDTLALTLAEYRQFDPLSSAKAEEIWVHARAGESRWVEILTHGCLGRVRNAALEFVGKGVLLLDLLQEGCLGLWQTIAEGTAEEFLPAAIWRARQAMARLVILQAVADHAGEQLVERMEAYQKTANALLRKLGRTASNAEIAEAMGLTDEQTENLARLAREAGNAPKTTAQAPETPDPEAEQSVEDSAYFALRSRVEELLSTLDEAGRRILTLRFGLDGKPARTTEEIQAQTGLSPQEIQRREAEALSALRKSENAENPGD